MDLEKNTMTQDYEFDPEELDEIEELEDVDTINFEEVEIPKTKATNFITKYFKFIAIGCVILILIIGFFVIKGVFNKTKDKDIIDFNIDINQPTTTDTTNTDLSTLPSLDFSNENNYNDADRSVYNKEQIEVLRSYGFNSEEIDTFAIDKKPFDEICQEQEKKIVERYEKILALYKDKESPEYRKLLKQTFLGEKQLRKEITSETEIVERRRVTDYSTKYYKVKNSGSTLYLKVVLPNEMGSSFYPVSLDLYKEAKDEGYCNIDLSYIVTATDNIVESISIRLNNKD